MGASRSAWTAAPETAASALCAIATLRLQTGAVAARVTSRRVTAQQRQSVGQTRSGALRYFISERLAPPRPPLTTTAARVIRLNPAAILSAPSAGAPRRFVLKPGQRRCNEAFAGANASLIETGRSYSCHSPGQQVLQPLTPSPPCTAQPSQCSTLVTLHKLATSLHSCAKLLHPCCPLQSPSPTMPIFHDPHESPPRRPSSRQVSSDAFQRDGTAGFGFDTRLTSGFHAGESVHSEMFPENDPESPYQARKPPMFDRMGLIERLKRSNSPSWPQRQGVSGCHVSTNPGPSQLLCQGNQRADAVLQTSSQQDQGPENRPGSPLLPSAEVKPSPTSSPDPLRDMATAGLEIERPRSALHSGDFREKKDDTELENGASSSGFLATSPVVPWNRSFPAAAFPSYRNEAVYHSNEGLTKEARLSSRARAISQSSLNSFAFLPPTSPLVHQANNTDLDFSSRPSSRQGSNSPERSNRRHTYSPTSFQSYQSIQMARSTSGTPAARHLRHGSSIPYQAHQPRRASTFNQFQAQSNPPTPYLNSRRPSFSSEASPLQHAPMVGSYEESILRGRMSTTPSRPLDFVAKIGVLGKGQCKASLKCPAHVTVPFPAVFYSYNTGNGRISDNEPSPYVGLIDLENSLDSPEESNDSSKRKRRHAVPAPDQDDADFRLYCGQEGSSVNAKEDLRRREKKKRRSTSPKAPPGGSYRIPPQGQLQIVLKNPNKTAVKLFLVPYDLSDMEPGQKTFIRQRSYSAGPIIDMPASSRKNLGTDRPEAALSSSDDPNDRPILRYLIHLHICCPSKGRYYLYKSIRVVFANRVPDGKEKLRNEIQLPEPRYSVYKPTRDSILSQAASSAGAQLTAEKAFRRRSAGWPLSRSQQAYEQIDGLRQYSQLPPPAVKFTGGTLSSSASSGFSSPMPDLQPIPFNLTRLAAIESRPVSREHMDIDPKSPFKTPVASPKPSLGRPNSQEEGTFEKLNRGDVGYGGNAFSPISSPSSTPNASLLSQRLRGLDVQHDTDAEY